MRRHFRPLLVDYHEDFPILFSTSDTTSRWKNFHLCLLLSRKPIPPAETQRIGRKTQSTASSILPTMRENFGGKSISPINQYLRDLTKKIHDSGITWPSYAKWHNRNILHYPPCSIKTSRMRFNSSRQGWNFNETGERKSLEQNRWVLGYAAPQTFSVDDLLTSPGQAYSKQQAAWPRHEGEECTPLRWLDASNNYKCVFILPARKTPFH